jgi:hypothetical protein
LVTDISIQKKREKEKKKCDEKVSFLEKGHIKKQEIKNNAKKKGTVAFYHCS